MKFTLLSILLNHSTFLLASLTNETAIQPTQATSQSLVQVEQECIICLKEMQSVELYPSFECFHENIHKACVHKYMNTAHTYARCPLCRAKPAIEPYVILEQVVWLDDFHEECSSKTTVRLKENLVERIESRETLFKPDEWKDLDECAFTLADMIEFIHLASLNENWGLTLHLLERVKKVSFNDLNAVFLNIKKHPSIDLKHGLIQGILSATDRPSHLQVRAAHLQCLIESDSVCNQSFLLWYATRAQFVQNIPTEPRIDLLIEQMFTVQPEGREWIVISLLRLPLLRLPRSILSSKAYSTLLELGSRNKYLFNLVIRNVLNAMEKGVKLNESSMEIVLFNVYWTGNTQELLKLTEYRKFTRNNMNHVIYGYDHASDTQKDNNPNKEEKMRILINYKNSIEQINEQV